MNFHQVTATSVQYIDVRYHFIRECISNNSLSIHYKQTNEMVADIMTKGLEKIKHSYFVHKLGLII